MEAQLMEGGLVDKSSEKWSSLWESELVYAWPYEHTLNMTWQEDILNQQDNICSVWLTNVCRWQVQDLG